MKLPKTVKIGGLNFAIKLADEPIVLEEQGEKEHGGLIDYGTTTITLYKGFSDEYLELILLHEIIHGIWEHMTIDSSVDEEETVVSKLANGLHQVLKDNKDLFK